MEICVDSVESAINAVNGGAHRLELCSALSEGGLTPSLGLLKTLKTIVSIPIFVMLRPRSGYDFQFSDLEIKVILEDCALFKDAGADGFVFGALTSIGDIDIAACASVILTAQPLPVTFHRAFDVATQNPIKMAQKIADLGFKRLLTSGRSHVAFDGKCLIKILIETMKDRLIIIPGAGIQVDNLKDILVTTLAHEFHGSAKVLKQYSNINNIKLHSIFKEDPIYITDCDTVKELLNIYKNNLKLE
ncbi:copper homeostasis protein cutC homolog [Rhopalosiphum padi]|uniref:copper homeostasis protein cutC homolog n=1 Tax=Rhopalosiphum padi TaxID=40932 RepID=UPI00298E442E|nr:copper homeostasis protein cutC homolog [Rhopalosiphum padi]XP_060847809.1 copper homeostasis protein cutC homolog [Rhopalosiphum padi]